MLPDGVLVWPPLLLLLELLPLLPRLALVPAAALCPLLLPLGLVCLRAPAGEGVARKY